MDPARFPLDIGWQRFVNRLAVGLRVMDGGQYLLLEPAGASRYLQFAPYGSAGLLAEVSSNRYLPEEERFTVDEMVLLAELGWRDPSEIPPDLGSEGSPNFFREWGRFPDHAAIAELAARTLVHVVGVARPHDLRYHAFHTDGGEIELPLGIEER